MLFAMSVNNFRGCVGAQRFSRKRMWEIFWSDAKIIYLYNRYPENNI